MQTKPISNILVITAMNAEHSATLKHSPHTEIHLSKTFDLKFNEIKTKATTIRIINAGIGSINTGIALALMIERFLPDAVIALGVGGALDPSLNIGDLVFSKDVIQHDSKITLERGTELMVPGEPFLSIAAQERVTPQMLADPTLLKHVQTILEKQSNGRKIFSGTILSGAEFVGSSERKHNLKISHPEALLVDMEACAIAQVCRRQKIPFLIAKTVADRMNPDDAVSSDYLQFLEIAADRASQLIKALVSE